MADESDLSINEKYIDLILEQVPEATRSESITALITAKGNVVDAIMTLSFNKESVLLPQSRDVRFLRKKFPGYSPHVYVDILEREAGSLVRAIVRIQTRENEDDINPKTGSVYFQRFITEVNYLVSLGYLNKELGNLVTHQLCNR